MHGGVVVHVHGAELEHRERLRRLADALLPEEHRPARRQLHQRGDREKQRRQHQQQARLPAMSSARLNSIVGRRDVRCRTNPLQQRFDTGQAIGRCRRPLLVDVQLDREARRRIRLQPPGQLAAHAHFDVLRSADVGHANLGKDDAKRPVLLEPAEDVRLALGSAEGADGPRPRSPESAQS